jgi:hypothetical protein
VVGVRSENRTLDRFSNGLGGDLTGSTGGTMFVGLGV